MITPKLKNQSVTFGPCRLCYVSVFEKHKFEGDQGEGKYMTNILIPKSEKETIKAIRQAIEAAKGAGLTGKWGGKLPKNYKEALYDGDEKDDPVFNGHYYLNPKSNVRPYLVGRDKQPLTDPEELYSGVWAVASVSFFPYNKGGNGVGCSLSGLMKFKDDERIGGSGSQAASDFADIDMDNESDDDL